MKTHRSRTRREIFAHSLCFVIFAGLASPLVLQAFPPKLGLLTGDGHTNATPFDLARLINHIHGTPRLSVEWSVFADMNQDGVVNETDADLLADAVVGNTVLPDVPLNRPYESSPANGENDVAVTRETFFRLVQPLGTNAVTTNHLYAEFGGQRLNCRCELSADRRTVTLFYLDPLPASARVRVSFDGAGLSDFLGRSLDLDGDGQPGGTAKVDFDTLSLSPLAGTAVIGWVYAAERLPVPAAGGPSPSPGGEGRGEGEQQTIFTNRPLAGVTITADGMETELRAVTDTNGFFHLEPVPPGRFFVHVDGRTAVGSQWPGGPYYPVVGEGWHAVAGRTNLAGGTGVTYLPFVTPGTLQPVSATQDTMITFPPSVIASNPALAGVNVMVPANSLFREDGTRGGMVGIGPVPTDRLPGPLPPGLQFPVVITVQTDGGENFDQPVPACFPNLPDPVTGQPLPPGTKNWLYSFNHDKGEWEAIGPMTVSEDGRMICTDPGVGILAPGWHGSGPNPDGPPPPPPPPRTLECYDHCAEEAIKVLKSVVVGHVVCRWAKKIPIIGGPLHRICEVVHRVVFFWETILVVKCELRCAFGRQATPLAEGGGIPPELVLDDPVAQQILVIMQQAYNTAYPYAANDQVPPPEIIAALSNALAQADTIAGGDAITYLSNYLSRLDSESAAIAEPMGSAPSYPIRYRAEIERPNDVLILRGETGPFGQYSLFVPRDGTVSLVTFYDPRSKSYGFVYPRLRPGVPYRLPRVYLTPVDSSFADTDGDGLPDVVELIYGTRLDLPDSDGDGINDGAEVDAGTNPLDGLPAATGILNTVRTPGPALDVCAINDIAIVAQGNSGVSVVNVVNGQNPIIIAQVDTPGYAQSVTCSGNLIAVADGAAGLAIIDITDPPAARIVRQLNFGSSVTTVASGGGIAYAGLASGQLVAVDMATGTILATINAGGAIHDLGLAGDSLFVLRSDQLRAYSLTGGFLDFQGSVSVSGLAAEGITGRKRLFVGTRIAYATSYPGYDTIDVSDPRNLRRIGTAQDTGPNSFKQIVDNGSGLGVAAVGVNPRDDGTHDVSLYDVSNPTNTTRFLTQFPTPGLTRSISIYNGLAYVADGNSGLQVVNYRAYDSQGVPPTITLTTSFPPGVAEEGKLMRLTATVSDDVQVRNVEFYVDGVKAVTDGNFPFEHRFMVPFKTAAKTNFTIQAKATDTGGNFTWTSNLVINLVPDATPPRVVRTSPANGDLFAQTPIVAFWSESINPSTVSTGTFNLFLAGPDSVPGTTDDVSVTGGVIQYRDDIAALSMSFSVPLTGGIYRAIVRPPIADVLGNTLVTNYAWSFQVPLQMAYGQTVGRTITTAVPKHSYTFDAQAGDIVWIWVNDGANDFFAPFVELLNTNGVRLTSVSHPYSSFLQYALTNTGSYYILVSDDDGAHNGSYQINLQRLNPPANAVGLSYGQTTNGTISVYGQWNAYQFAGSAGDVVRLRANDGVNDYFGPTIELFTATGARVGTATHPYDANLQVTLTNGGNYYVLVSDDDGAHGGTYQLSLQRLNPPAGVVPLAYGGTAAGSISRFGHWNSYTFDAQAGDIARIWVNDGLNDYFAPYVELFNASGLRLAAVSHAYSSFLQYALTNTGSYYILVSDDDGAHNGSYQINLQRLNPPANAVGLSYGQTTNGTISVYGQWNAYQFAGSAGDVVRLRANDGVNDYFGPTIELFTATGARVGTATHPYDANLQVTLTNGGNYYVLVSDDDGAHGGTYQLSLQRLNPPAGVVPLAYGGTAAGSISRFGHWNSYTFDAQAGDIARIWVNDGLNDYFAPYVELFNASGLRLAAVSHAYSSFLQYALTNTGSYYILVSDDDGAHNGSYQINLQRLNPPANAVGLSYGQTTNGTISVYGQWNAYQFAGSAGDVVRLRANDGVNDYFGPTIELFTATGARVGTATHPYDANLQVTLTNGGNYYVLVSDDDGAHGGTYQLSLQRLNPPAGVVPLAYGGTAAGSISRFGHWNSYTFDAQAGDIARIWVNDGLNDYFAPYVELFNASGLRLAAVSHAYSSFLQYALTNTGSYYILVSDDDGAHNGSYQINLQRLNPPANAVGLSYGQTTNGTISVYGQWNAYQFAGSAGDVVRLRANDGVNDYFGPTIELFTATGARVGTATHPYDANLQVTLTNGGNYYVLVSDDDGAHGGTYQFTVQRLNDRFISTNSVWKYLDDGSDRGTNWVKTNFVDAAWSSGPAQLGYGDGDEATVVSFGPDANNKYITTYFRRSFSVTNASTYTNLTLRLLRDDGAVVYLNGVEVFRSNLPAGPVAFTTLASADVSGTAESAFVTASLNPALLVNGPNVLAVEIHQSAPDSDDLSFDLELIGIRTP